MLRKSRSDQKNDRIVIKMELNGLAKKSGLYLRLDCLFKLNFFFNKYFRQLSIAKRSGRTLQNGWIWIKRTWSDSLTASYLIGQTDFDSEICAWLPNSFGWKSQLLRYKSSRQCSWNNAGIKFWLKFERTMRFIHKDIDLKHFNNFCIVFSPRPGLHNICIKLYQDQTAVEI